MHVLTFKKNDVKYPITLYGKINYLTGLIKRNHRRLLNYVDSGNWVAENQNVLVQFITNMAVDLDWDDEYIYSYIKANHKTVASLLGITSLYNKGIDHPKTLFPENTHHTLLVVPFGSSEYTSQYYFQECPLKNLYPLRTLFTTDTDQRWDTYNLTDNASKEKGNSIYSIVQLDPFALIIGYVRYCRERIANNQLVGITAQSYIMRYPISNFYFQHNLMVAMNYCLEGVEGYELREGKFNIVDYSRWLKEYSLFTHHSMIKFNPVSINQYIEQNKVLNCDGVLDHSVYPFMGMSASFDKLGIVYCFNSMHIAMQYSKYCKLTGKPDGTFLNTVKKFLRGSVSTMSQQISDPLWKKLFVDMFNDLKKQIEK